MRISLSLLFILFLGCNRLPDYILSKNKRLLGKSKKKMQLNVLHKYQENYIQEGNY